MRPVSASELVAAAWRQNQELEAELQAFALVERDHQRMVAAVDADLEAAWNHLVEAVLPRLDVAVLDAAARALSLAAVSSAAVRARIAEDEAEQRAWIAEVDAHPDWARREAIANEIAIKTAELDENIAPLKSELDALAREPFWVELYDEGYATPSYRREFWQLSYYRHWKQGDIVVETYGPRWNATDFATLRAKHDDAQRALATLTDEREALRERARAMGDLVQTRADAELAIRDRGPRALAEARARVRAHLEPMDGPTLAALLAYDEATRVAAARVAGVRAKKEYLLALHKEHVQVPREAAKQAIARNRKDAFKLSKAKYAHRSFPRADFERRFKDRAGALRKRRERWRDASQRVVAFEDYGRWDPVRDFIWWDLMTDGRVDGDFIPAVRAHHQEHGAYDRAQAAVLTEQRDFASSDAGRFDAS